MHATSACLTRQPDLPAFLDAARPRLHGLLVSLRVPLEDADDVLQDSFLALLDPRHALDGIADPEAWLAGTLRNTIRQYWRRRQRRSRFLARWSRTAPTSEPAPQERQDAARDVAALTAHLPLRDVEVIWLRFGLGLKPREIAKTLGLKPDSVRKIGRRALERVRRQLAAAGHPRALCCAAPAARVSQPVAVAPAGAERGSLAADRTALPRPHAGAADASRVPHRHATCRHLRGRPTPPPKARRR
ncbi:MAG TPA: sigma-70 family RNA polymerase sigma factor [Thermoanaerobaculia bacterium]